MALGPGVVHPVAAPHRHQGLIHLLLIDSEFLENRSGIALGLHGGGDE